MADIQKPVEVTPAEPTDTDGVTEKPVESTTAAAHTDAVPAATEEVKPAAATETPAVAATEAPATEATPAAEAVKESKPVEAGNLEHKPPASFPKNLIYTKQHFWFGEEPVTAEKLSTYMKTEKVTEVAHHVAAWASNTGKGLLFYGKEADKSAPHGAIQLAEAEEPKPEGPNKFLLVSKGNKHTFKAANATERDSWVAQLKTKIVEAKELATSITESESYKSTLESFKPKPVAKKEAAPKEEGVAAAGAAAAATTAAATTETPKQDKLNVNDDKKAERRSASRKRGSIFGNLLGKKDEAAIANETQATEPAAEGTKAVEITKPVETTKPAEVTPVVPAVVDTVDTKPTESVVAPQVEAPKETPAVQTDDATKESKAAPTKRNSIFGGLSFGGNKAKKPTETETTAPAVPAKDSTVPASDSAPVVESGAVAQTAPVIPAVETTEPLSADVSSPATVPVETIDASAPATNGESKKDVKSDKRKSSLPFAFGAKKDKATSPEEDTEKKPFFSKLRQTVKGKSSAKTEKPAESTATPATAAATEPTTTTAAPAVTEETAIEAPKTTTEGALETEEVKPAPAAPVTAAA